MTDFLFLCCYIGMVYVDPKNLNYDPFWQKWLSLRTNKAEQELLETYYKKYTVPCIDMVINMPQNIQR